MAFPFGYVDLYARRAEPPSPSAPSTAMGRGARPALQRTPPRQPRTRGNDSIENTMDDVSELGPRTSAPNTAMGRGRGARPAVEGRITVTGIATLIQQAEFLQGPPPPPLPLDLTGAPVYMGDWINLTTGQTLAHVHVLGHLTMHVYSDVRVQSRFVGRAVLTSLGVEQPRLPHHESRSGVKINLRMANRRDNFRDVGTLWLTVPTDICDREELMTLSHRRRRSYASLHIQRCNCYRDE